MMQKIHAAREMFIAFSNRSQAYSFKHLIGLISFHSTHELLQPLTSNFSRFMVSNVIMHANVHYVV